MAVRLKKLHYLEKIKREYFLIQRKNDLKEACIDSIKKWEEVINEVLKYDKLLGSEFKIINKIPRFDFYTCGLCKFFFVTNSKSSKCKLCPLENCKKDSIYFKIITSNSIEDYVKYAYQIIKKIRTGYKKITGNDLDY